MKKVLVLGTVLAASVAAYGQSFSAKNVGAGAILSPDGVTKAPSATTDVEILYNGSVVATGKEVIAGTFAFGTVTLTGVTAATVSLTVDAWDTTTGATYAAATTKATETITQTLAYGTTPPGSMSAFTALTLTGQVTPTPEPSTYALGALGLGALLFISRRK